MDDRDFIYWIGGIFDFGNFNDFDTLNTEHVEQIIENICDVYEHVQKYGLINDFDSMRIISFIEGALMYYGDLPIDHKIKVTNLIRSEVEDAMNRLRDQFKEKMPLLKRKLDNDLKMDVVKSVEVFPISSLDDWKKLEEKIFSNKDLVKVQGKDDYEYFYKFFENMFKDKNLSGSGGYGEAKDALELVDKLQSMPDKNRGDIFEEFIRNEKMANEPPNIPDDMMAVKDGPMPENSLGAIAEKITAAGRG